MYGISVSSIRAMIHVQTGISELECSPGHSTAVLRRTQRFTERLDFAEQRRIPENLGQRELKKRFPGLSALSALSTK
jgi:hypothetical protein